MVGYVVEFYLTKTIARVKFEWMLNDFFLSSNVECIYGRKRRWCVVVKSIN